MVLLTGSCQHSSPKKTDEQETVAPLFSLLRAGKTHIDFNNILTEGAGTNVLMYEYFYNGGGVAAGDVNNDGLEDVYFSANMTPNRLYLNKGNMEFGDITDAAGVAGRSGPWKTGVTMADVNGDGWLDIYVCYSGNLSPERLISQLFINDGADQKGVPHFTEKTQEYGFANPANTTQAFFFDYDKDGDLDMFLLNHNPQPLPPVDDIIIAEMLKKEDAFTGIRLWRNDMSVNGTPHFIDVTQKAGLKSTYLSYGLGAGISDLNNDGWPDIYVANDYIAPDCLYINNKNGTFSDKLANSIGHTAHSSMGNSVADINNDGLPDIFVLDMLPEDNKRQKLLFAPDNYEKFDLNIRTGLHHQYMRNMLQLNNGNGTFSEIGQQAGLSNTDWSWAPLIADYDNDGWKDIFITNGYVRDFTNQDFIKYMNDYLSKNNQGQLRDEEIIALVHTMPSSNVINYLFRNNGDLTFANTSKSSGINVASNSNGAAYADLDNDGDLDLVVNNINQPAFIYQNNTDNQLNHYLQINLTGASRNTRGIGAKVIVYNKNQSQYLEQMPARGFQSTVSSLLHFGLGEQATVDSLRVVWLSGKEQLLKNVKANQVITLNENEATSKFVFNVPVRPIFEEIKPPVNYRNAANKINDFKRQPQLINPLSFLGPCLAKKDVNGDGLEDIYTGGGSGQAGALYIQLRNKNFIKKPEPAFEQDTLCEDADAIFLDANNDGFQDLYVASGGYHNYAPDDILLQDRLYLNDGNGNFTKSLNALPSMKVSKSCSRAADFNGDGYADIFIGGRSVPGKYPETPSSFLLINDGKGHFTDQITTIAPALRKAGMITDAAWIDINNDKKIDLVVVGEWMPVSVFLNTNGKLENKTTAFFKKQYNGWWNKLLTGDFNKDGRQDLIVGNVGLNTQCKASDTEPAEMFYKDFDNNGSVDPILCFYIQHKSYPYVSRDELLDQMSMMRTRFADYKTYAEAGLTDIFTAEELSSAKQLKANYLKTAFFEGNADGTFHEKALPLQAQYSPVYTITPLDFNRDGNEDLLLCGNINHARLKFGKYDANYGILLEGDGKSNFKYVGQQQSGFHLWGDVRSVISLGDVLLFGINQDAIKAYKLK